MIDGDVEIEGQKLNRRDGFGVWNKDTINVTSNGKAKLLAMEVPMSL